MMLPCINHSSSILPIFHLNQEFKDKLIEIKNIKTKLLHIVEIKDTHKNFPIKIVGLYIFKNKNKKC